MCAYYNPLCLNGTHRRQKRINLFAVFEDPNAVTLEDLSGDEQRYITIGMDTFGRILVVFYTWRGDNIRIISARKAVRYEVKQYEGEI